MPMLTISHAVDVCKALVKLKTKSPSRLLDDRGTTSSYTLCPQADLHINKSITSWT
jgi:hypothetical protein